jgi:signal transduction histidine kinase
MSDLSSSADLLARHEAALRESAQVAHDLNNLLLVIRGYCSVLLKRAADDASRAQLGHIDEAASKASELTARLLTRRDG